MGTGGVYLHFGSGIYLFSVLDLVLCWPKSIEILLKFRARARSKNRVGGDDLDVKHRKGKRTRVIYGPALFADLPDVS